MGDSRSVVCLGQAVFTHWAFMLPLCCHGSAVIDLELEVTGSTPTPMSYCSGFVAMKMLRRCVLHIFHSRSCSPFLGFTGSTTVYAF